MIDLLPNTEQRQISNAVAKALSETIDLENFNSPDCAPGSGHDGSFSLLADMGMFGLAIPESEGGVGCSLVDEALIFCEVGRSLATPLTLATSLAAHLLSASGSSPELLLDIIAGKQNVDLAYALPDDTYYWISDGRAAHVLLIHPESLRLIPRAEITEGEMLSCLDPCIPLSYASVSEHVSTLASSTCSIMRGRYYILLAAMLLGIAEATLKMAVEHAKTREQFGRQIGSFQAIKHRCADMAVAAEVASAHLRYAALMIDSEGSNFDSEAMSALVISANAAEQNCLSNIQIHGGMGFTAECPAHMYLKRTHLLNNLTGGTRSLYDRILPADSEMDPIFSI